VESQRVVELDVLNSWRFDTLLYTHDELNMVVTHIFSVLGLTDEFNVPRPVFQAFLKEVENRYINTNPYHNYKHGCDVFHTHYRYMTIIGFAEFFTKVEIFASLVGALAHDIGHLGVNNLFLVKSLDPLALLHNDRSPLENMHCTILYEILRKEETNIFMNLSHMQWRQVRNVILTSILGTDMGVHFEAVSKLKVCRHKQYLYTVYCSPHCRSLIHFLCLCAVAHFACVGRRQ
jgi:hypothetical protein